MFTVQITDATNSDIGQSLVRCRLSVCGLHSASSLAFLPTPGVTQFLFSLYFLLRHHSLCSSRVRLIAKSVASQNGYVLLDSWLKADFGRDFLIKKS